MKRRATGIQKIEPKPKKRNTSPSAPLSSSFSNEEKDAYRMKKGAYILTWHDFTRHGSISVEDNYERDFYKKEVIISSDSGRAKINISDLMKYKSKDRQFTSEEELEIWMIENLSDYDDDDDDNVKFFRGM